MHLGMLSDSRRDALATSIVTLNGQKSSTSTKRDTTMEITSFNNVRQMSCHLRQFVCRRLFASGLKIPLCLANPLGSYLRKFSGLRKLIKKCVVLDTHHCPFGSHWRKANRLVFGGQSDRACFHSQNFYRFRSRKARFL